MGIKWDPLIGSGRGFQQQMGWAGDVRLDLYLGYGEFDEGFEGSRCVLGSAVMMRGRDVFGELVLVEPTIIEVGAAGLDDKHREFLASLVVKELEDLQSEAQLRLLNFLREAE